MPNSAILEPIAEKKRFPATLQWRLRINRRANPWRESKFPALNPSLVTPFPKNQSSSRIRRSPRMIWSMSRRNLSRVPKTPTRDMEMRRKIPCRRENVGTTPRLVVFFFHSFLVLICSDRIQWSKYWFFASFFFIYCVLCFFLINYWQDLCFSMVGTCRGQEEEEEASLHFRTSIFFFLGSQIKYFLASFLALEVIRSF